MDRSKFQWQQQHSADSRSGSYRYQPFNRSQSSHAHGMRHNQGGSHERPHSSYPLIHREPSRHHSRDQHYRSRPHFDNTYQRSAWEPNRSFETYSQNVDDGHHVNYQQNDKLQLAYGHSDYSNQQSRDFSGRKPESYRAMNQAGGGKGFCSAGYSNNTLQAGYRDKSYSSTGSERFHPYKSTTSFRDDHKPVALSHHQVFKTSGDFTCSNAENRESDLTFNSLDRKFISAYGSSGPFPSSSTNLGAQFKHVGGDGDEDDFDDDDEDAIDEDVDDDDECDSEDNVHVKEEEPKSKKKKGKKLKKKNANVEKETEIVHVEPVLSFDEYTSLWENERNPRMKKLRLMACKASVCEMPRSISKISDNRSADCNLRVKHRFDKALAKKLGKTVVAHLLMDGIVAATGWGPTKVDAKRSAYDEALRVLYMPYLRVFTAEDEHRELHGSLVPFSQAMEHQILKPHLPMAPMIIEHTKYRLVLPKREKIHFRRNRKKKNKKK